MVQRRTLLASAAALVAAPAIVRADTTWPQRPVRVIVPWPPGGGVDTFARIVQPALAAELGQNVVVENVGGSSGRIGTWAASRAAADGYTVALVNDSFAATEAIPLAGSPSVRDALLPVTLAIDAPQGLFTHPKSGIATVQDYIAAATSRPGQLNVGVPGLGSSQHLTSELLLRAAGDRRVTHVPYRGGGPLLQDLVAGTVDAAVVTFSAGAQQSRAGTLVPLAITSAARVGAFPSVPTVGETVAPGFVQTTWQGFLVPKGTPNAVSDRLHRAILVALADAAVAKRLEELGFTALGRDSTAFGGLIERTVATFASIAGERRIVAEG